MACKKTSCRWLYCLGLVVGLAGMARVAGANEPIEVRTTKPRPAEVPVKAHEETDVEPAARIPDQESDEDLDRAPLPQEASGILIERDRSRHVWLAIPRAMLFVPRWALEVPIAVSRYTLWAYEHYDVKDRFKQVFFNQDETLGLYPSAFLETGFGYNVGARFVWTEFFGKGESIRARAGYGGRSERVFEAKLSSGRIFDDRILIGTVVDYEDSGRARFFGLGNSDLVTFDRDLTPVAAPFDETAVATRFAREDVRVELLVQARLSELLAVRTSSAFRHSSFGRSTDMRGDDGLHTVYDTGLLVGHDPGLDSLYGEVELACDTRRVSYSHLPEPVPSRGHRIDAWIGYQRGLAGDPSRFVRFGAEAQRYFDLWRGDRVLVLRARFEGVVGGLDRIPFVDFPALGGPYVLRGYPRDRFRDRHAGLLTAEYNYPIQHWATGYIFAEAGRVWRRFGDLNLDDNRLGFGAGMQFSTMESFLARLLVASSIDGGIEFSLSFDPIFGARKRAGRTQ